MTRITIGPTCWKVLDYSLGDAGLGGYVICKSGGTAWIVAPSNTEVSRTFSLWNDAVTTAQSFSGCTGWFVPTSAQYQNPGYICRTYWDNYKNTNYWTSSSCTYHFGVIINMSTGTVSGSSVNGAFVACSRAFRCVTY